jgi:hypothetical protein
MILLCKLLARRVDLHLNPDLARAAARVVAVAVYMHVNAYTRLIG